MAEDSFIPVSSTSTIIRPRKSIIKKSKKRVPLIVITSTVEETPKPPVRRTMPARLYIKKFKTVKKKPKEEYPRGSFWVGERKLGAGGFGTVYLVKTGSFPFQMANKTAPVQKAVTLKYERRDFSEYLKGTSPYIVQCYGDEITDRGVNGDKVYNLFLEYCSGGSLCDRIKESVAGIPESEVKLYARNIVSGLMYIHGKNIAHLDIKPTNILLTPTGYVKD